MSDSGTGSTPSITTIISICSAFDQLADYTLDCGASDSIVISSNRSAHKALLSTGFANEHVELTGDMTGRSARSHLKWHRNESEDTPRKAVNTRLYPTLSGTIIALYFTQFSAHNPTCL